MKSKTITIRVSQETADRCERLRLAGPYSGYMDSAFARIIFNIGLEKYEKVYLPIENGEKYKPRTAAKIIPFPEQIENEKANEETRLQAADYDAPVEKPLYSEEKIISFPGVSINHVDDFQNTLDGFLKEIGYVE